VLNPDTRLERRSRTGSQTTNEKTI